MTDDPQDPRPPAGPDDAPTRAPSGSSGEDPPLDPADLPTRTSGNLPTQSVRTSDPGASSASPLPDRVGRYRILGKLGEGGMGVVYEAEQQEPRRRVALKVVRGGEYVDEARVRMFQREADTLARLKHPNIGAIYESGRTESGQHFFAMELVRGETLDRYLAARPAVTGAHELRFRLALFRKIADAVHYAHQRGVIHRDLKPSNIVVTEEAAGEEAAAPGSTLSGLRLPQVKILDFGLARITEGDVHAATQVTEVGVIKGTLPYMSPEQARGNPEAIDLRTDVYALGVILYEMLSGQRPIDVDRAALVEAVRVICEEPPRLLRQTMSGMRRLDPDVETIVGKALEKEAERRYASAAALSEDVARYLTSQPILARPPSAAYQLRKFASRNRALVGGIAATFVVLVAGVITSTVFGLREAAQRREVEAARTDLEAVVAFQEQMLSDVDPAEIGLAMVADLTRRAGEARRRAGGDAGQVESAEAEVRSALSGLNPTDVALRVVDEDILRRAARTIEADFEDRPRLAARLALTVGRTYTELGLLDRAADHVSDAVEVRERVLGSDHPETLSARSELVRVLTLQGRIEEALTLARATLERQRALLGDDHRATLKTWNRLAVAHENKGQIEEADGIYRMLLERSRALFGDEDLDTLWLLNNAGYTRMLTGHPEEAEALLTEAVERFKSVAGPTDRETLWVMDTLAGFYEEQSRPDEAVSLKREVLQARRASLGDAHPDTMYSVGDLARFLGERGRFDEAESLYLEALDTARSAVGEQTDAPSVMNLVGGLARLREKQGRFAEAEAGFRRALTGLQRSSEDSAGVAWMRLQLGGLLTSLGRYAEAEPQLRDALESLRGAEGEDSRNATVARTYLATLLAVQGRVDEAAAIHREALDTFRETLGEDHRSTLSATVAMSQIYVDQGRSAEAEPMLRRAVEGFRRTLGDDDPTTLHAVGTLGSVLSNLKKYGEAEPLLRLALQGRRRIGGDDDPTAGTLLNNLANVLRLDGRPAEAEPLFREALEISRRVRGEDNVSTLIAMGNLGDLVCGLGRHDEALTLLASAREGVGRVLPPQHPIAGATSRKYGACLTEVQRFEEAEASLLQALDVLTEALGAEHPQTQKVFSNLVGLYEAWGKRERAAGWRARLSADK